MNIISVISIIATAIVLILILRLFYINRFIKRITSSIRSQRTSKLVSPSSQSALAELELQVREWAEERKQEFEHLQKLESYRKDFLGDVSHELKTPIFNIQGYLSTLLDGGLEDATINRDYLKGAMKNVDRMIATIQDLQAITQLERGELEIEEEPFNIVELVHEVMESQEFMAKGKGISFELANDLSHPIIALADRIRIRQVIVNLIINSIRYGKNNGRTTAKISDTGEKIIVEVSDNGIGIPKEQQDRIFERFFRVDKSRSQVRGGTGLGLSIVKHILEAHNRTINVMSTDGVGSAFTFTLRKG